MFSVFGKNLTNAVTAIYPASSAIGDQVVYDTPRTRRVSVSLNF